MAVVTTGNAPAALGGVGTKPKRRKAAKVKRKAPAKRAPAKRRT